MNQKHIDAFEVGLNAMASTMTSLRAHNDRLEQENRELKQFIVALLLIILAFCAKYWGIL